MLEIQRNTLIKAIKLLNSIEVEYAILANEEKHGTLEILPKKTSAGSRSFSHKYGRGVVASYVKPYIDGLKVGEVVSIPAGDFELEAVAASAATHAHKLFGNNGHTGHKNNKTNSFELLRLEV